MDIWLGWMILGTILVIAEIFTAGFFLLWFGIGAFVAGIVALTGGSQILQLLSFAVVSGLLFAASRKIAERITKPPTPGIGANRFLGKRGVVLERIDNITNTGIVRIDQDEWRAYSENDNVIIPEGKLVEVIDVRGTHLVVRQVM